MNRYIYIYIYIYEYKYKCIWISGGLSLRSMKIERAEIAIAAYRKLGHVLGGVGNWTFAGVHPALRNGPNRESGVLDFRWACFEIDGNRES